MKTTEKIKKEISIRTRYGNYRTFIKEFNNRLHFERWYDKVSLTSKIIGVEDVK